MGLTQECDVIVDGRLSRASVLLEPSELRVLAPGKLIIPFKEILSAEPRAGVLRVRHCGGELTLHLGPAAEKWALKIRYPKNRTEKLGVKAGSRVAVSGLKDAGFLTELKSAQARPRSRLGTGPYDMVVVRLDSVTDLPRLVEARARIVSNGMVWAVWPKGRKEFREDDIRRYARASGLVDVKVMSFSEELSGLKLVIPVAQR